MKTNIKQQTLNELEISSNKCQMKPSIMRFIRDSIFKWESQAIQYPEKGSDLVYFKGVHPRGVTVHCLLYYGHDNFLEGILNYYPIDLLPWQKRGSVNILVRPDRRRNRIASSLLDEAIKRWNIKLEKQVYTKDGESFICKYISTSSIYKSYRKRF